MVSNLLIHEPNISAYDTLSDEEKRRNYDQFGEAGPNAHPGAGPHGGGFRQGGFNFGGGGGGSDNAFRMFEQ